ncbi:MAG TPA: Crp/Fnr family transcriptional regulator [Chitinophagaceae bacterium]|nr:Crp/Fnr family transcriptional regulator [Chitinophagaceae bacterium]
MSVEDKMILFRNYDLWCHFSDEDYMELHVIHNFIEAKKGDYIYFDSHYHNKLYFLKEGYIKIGYIDESGKEVIKEIIQKGELFGQITLEKSNLNGEFAQAYKGDVSLCSFNIEDFQKLLKTKPVLAIEYTKRVGNKLMVIQNRLINLLNKDVKTRLINFFAQLVEQNIGDKHGEGFCIPNYLTHEDIANLIGSTRQTVTTMINELEKEDVLSYSRNQICFLDVKKIQKLVTVA